MQPNFFETPVEDEYDRFRLDVFLAATVEDSSRSFIKKLIKDGRVTVNGGVCIRPGRTMTPGEKVVVDLPPPPSSSVAPENIPLDIVYQDRDLAIVNKPAGLVVHPAPGHYSGTLVNALLHHCPEIGGRFPIFGSSDDSNESAENREASPYFQDPARPGIVHRLDQFTSGLLVVAKTPQAFAGLSQQAREHAFDRRYLALARGEFPEARGRIDASVGRSLSDPSRMSVTGVKGRDAVTRFEVLERFGAASLLALVLETGRTHQIRVHLRFAGHPVLGDPIYGVTDYSGWKISDAARAALERLPGQALHAERLGIVHPVSGKELTFTAPPPEAFQTALDALRAM